MDVIALAVNVIIFQILESEETIFFRQQFLDVIALAVNVRDFKVQKQYLSDNSFWM